MQPQSVTLKTSCRGRRVPQGTSIELAEGSEVQVMQALGNSVTVQIGGNLVRLTASVAGKVLGQEYGEPSVAAADGPDHPERSLEERVWQVLHGCYDPEIPVDIVELGLVYDLRMTRAPTGGNRVEIRMTLTAAGCGMGPVLVGEIEDRLLELPGVDSVDVVLVYDPPWSLEMMSEAARLELGLL